MPSTSGTHNIKWEKHYYNTYNDITYKDFTYNYFAYNDFTKNGNSYNT